MKSLGFKNFFLGICAGFLIGIGGLAYLGLKGNNLIIAALMFCFGLYFIISKQYSLYTGKIGYCVDQNITYFTKTLLPTLGGNFVGTFLCAVFILCTSQGTKLTSTAESIMHNKIDMPAIAALMLSFFCGVIMYITVDVAKKSKGSERVCAVIMGVMTFILCGFNHSIADSFYIFMSSDLMKNFWQYMSYLLIAVVGNFFGGIFLPVVQKWADGER